MRKVYLLLTAVAVLAFLPNSTFASARPLGTNIMSPDGTVYTITSEDGVTVKSPYTSAGAFLSYGYNNWGSVVGASVDDLALPTGRFIPPQNGKIVCSDRGVDRGTCYLITAGKKAGFTSADVFSRLGYNFVHALYGDVSFLPSDSNISEEVSAHRPGALVNIDGTIYLVGNGALIGLPDWATLESWGYKITDIVPANSADRSMSIAGVLVPKTPDRISPPVDVRPYLIVSSPFVNFDILPGASKKASFDTTVSNNSTTKDLHLKISIPNQPAWLNCNYTTTELTINPLGSMGMCAAVDATGLSAGTYTTTIYMTGDFANSPAKMDITLKVHGTTNQPVAYFIINTASLAQGKVGVPYSQKIDFQYITTGTNYASNVTFSGLPPGITTGSYSGSNTTYGILPGLEGPMGKASVQISGTPTTAGSYAVKLMLDDQYGASLSKTFNLIISSAESVQPSITTTSLPDATIGQSYSTQIQVSGGTAPYNWSTVSTTYPSGCCVLGLNGNSGPINSNTITFNTQSGNTIIGPAGDFVWNLEVTDAYGKKASKAVSLKILPGLTPTFYFATATPLPNAKVGQYYNQNIKFYYSTAGTNYATNGTISGLPTGLGPSSSMGMLPGIDGPGQASYNINGVPTQAGTYTLTVSLTDQYYATKVSTYTLTVDPPDINMSNVRVGSLVNVDGTVYLVGDGGLFGFVTHADFSSWCLSFTDVLTANADEKKLPFLGIIPARGSTTTYDSRIPSSFLTRTCDTTRSLIATLSPNTPSPRTAQRGGTGLDLVSINIQNSNTFDVEVGEFTFVCQGCYSGASVSEFKKLYLFYNGSVLTTYTVSSASNGFYEISMSNGLVIPGGITANVVLRSDLDSVGSGVDNQGLYMELRSIGAVTSTGTPVTTVGLPIYGNLVTLKNIQ